MEFGKLCRRTAQTPRQAVGERRWVEGGAPGRSEQWSSGRRAFLPRWPSRHPLKQRAFPLLPLEKVLHRGRAGRALESLGPTAHLAGPQKYACWLKRGVWGDRALWGKGRHQWLRPHRSPGTPGGRGRGNPCWTAGLGRDWDPTHVSSSSMLRLLWPGCQLGEGFSFFPPAGGTYVTLTILYAVQREARVSKAPGNPSTPGSGGRM